MLMHRGQDFNEAPVPSCTGARSATLLEARLGPNSTMVCVLQELRLHQQAVQEGVPRELPFFLSMLRYSMFIIATF